MTPSNIIRLFAVFVFFVALSTDAKYLGCFIDTGDRRDLPVLRDVGASNSVSTCVAYCRDNGYAYAGLQATNWCLCGNAYGYHGITSDSECAHMCRGARSQMCGSYWRNSIYTTDDQHIGNRYLGCYTDSADRDLPVLRNVGSANSVSSCIAYCKTRGYAYAGLQATTWCLCGASYGKHGRVNDGQCNAICPGATNHYCGAGLRNSIYSTA